MRILNVAINVPLRQVFDYLIQDELAEQYSDTSLIGYRVRVPFGRQTKIAFVIGETEQASVDSQKLKQIEAVLDTARLIQSEPLELMKWASAYYHHPVGEVVSVALPNALRSGEPAQLTQIECWRVCTERDDPNTSKALSRAHKQRAFYHWLADQCELNETVTAVDCQLFSEKWRDQAKKCEEKSLIERYFVNQLPSGSSQVEPSHTLNEEQQTAVDQITGTLGQFAPCLLEGVTGSGKTEVYFHVIQQALDQGKQILVLIPEIALTMQLISRFRRRFPAPIALLHSGLNESERLQSWLEAHHAHARVVIGTRSAVWTSMPQLGLIVIDEEHDASFKQQEGFRYSARDVALVRAQRAKIPIILGSATPSLESLHNASQARYAHVQLTKRAGEATPPPIRIIDLRSVKLKEGLAPQLLDHIRVRLERGEQSLLFLNRRGFSPVVMCHDCGWIAQCRHCDAKMTYHQQHRVMRCHHCGAQRSMVPHCESCESIDLISVGHGTERVSEYLAQCFPDARILRIDRDTTRGKQTLTDMLAQVDQREVDILVGTQMLSKGHHFPHVTLVGILDADSGLYATDFRATERLAQLIVQVAGRAGRAALPGEVWIQTHHPEHPILQALAHYDLKAVSRNLLEERQILSLPPFASAVMLRADSPKSGQAMAFLQRLRAEIQSGGIPDGLAIWGPVVAPMERRAGRYRSQMLIVSDQRRVLHQSLTQWLQVFDQVKKPADLRWSVDVDVQDML